MRNRGHKVQLWLDDKEYSKLKKEVDKSCYNQSTYLRLLIEGNTVMACPTEFQLFKGKLWSMDLKFDGIRFNESYTVEEKAEVRAVLDELHKMIRMLSDIYFPYFKWKKEHVKQCIWLTELKKEDEVDGEENEGD